MDQSSLDLRHMRRALELAMQGQGLVEPNPMVGCVIARGAEVVGEGWHRRFGGDHAEVDALRLAGPRARGATLYVTLEPCCHFGKTPPCSRAVIAAGVGRVVAAMQDPFPKVSGAGLAEISSAGIEVAVGALEDEARQLNAPYLKLLATGRPWVLAKWAMSLDGKIATRSGDSRWISNPSSREIVHAIRGRVDAVIVGRETATRDDPLLTARPAGARTAVRIVMDTRAALDSESRLVRSAGESPVLVAAGPEAEEADRQRLRDAGCEVWICEGAGRAERLESLLAELGRRRMTNVLVEGGSVLLGTLFDLRAIDEVHVFVAPKLLGGNESPSPIGGPGIEAMSLAVPVTQGKLEQVGTDIYFHGRISGGG